MNKVNYTQYQQVLINKDILLMKSIGICYDNKLTSHDFLLANQINNSWISATSYKGPWINPMTNIDKNQLGKVYEKDKYAFIKEAYINPIQLQLQLDDNELSISMDMLMVTQFIMVNSYKIFDGFISVNQLAYDNNSKDKTEYYSTIIRKDGTIIINENYNELKIEQDKEEFIQFLHCDMIPSLYWSCNGSYIFFGDEYDIYLIRQLNKTIVFDRLSYYSLIPFDEWEYFRQEYFGKNEDCTNVLIPDSLPKMYYIQCSKLKTYQNDKRKIINFLIANVSIQYGDVFDDVLYLNNYTAAYLNGDIETSVYFNFLFCEELTYWVLGARFFENKTIGFDYKLKQTLIEILPERSFNFTEYFTNKESDFKMWLFIGTSATAVIIFIISGILNWRSRRQLDKEFKEMTTMIGDDEIQQEEGEVGKDEVDNEDEKEDQIEIHSLKENSDNKSNSAEEGKENNDNDDEDIVVELPIDEEISIVRKINH